MYLLTSIIEIICFLCAVLFLRNEGNTWWKGFTWFMLLTVLIEAGGLVCYFIYHQPNHWLYNLFLPVNACFTCWILYKAGTDFFKSRLWILAGFTIFSVIYLYNSIGFAFKGYSTNASNFISVFFIVTCCIYYYCLLKHEKYVHLVRYAPFWIVTGIFIFNFGRTGCNLAFEYLVKINTDQLRPIRFSIFVVLNFILYSSWIYAFFCKSRQRTSAISS